jgi:hypothetical protein
MPDTYRNLFAKPPLQGFSGIWLLISFWMIFIISSGCKKERIVVYEVNQERVYQNANEKKSLKNETEFISIAYSDLFETNITYDMLQKIQGPYVSFGDRGLMVDLIIRNFLASPAARIPSDSEMRADIPRFVSETYMKFYNREPNEYEQWKMEQMIRNDSKITAELVYYAMMTSDEYRYY